MNNQETAREILIKGVVQAVGFRPFIYRRAHKNNLHGWVKNLGDAGVWVFTQGKPMDIDSFIDDVKTKNPPLAKIDSIQIDQAEIDFSLKNFTIKKSSSGSSGSGTIPPDIATCEQCLEDVFGDTRYSGYWATSCVNCGPRFSIIRKLPYDRPNTAMDDFPMCEECHAEYTDPQDRRYHAQTIACPECGPELWHTNSIDKTVETENPIETTVSNLTKGEAVAIKGLGGTHLACDATNQTAVNQLRSQLDRPQQPFALMGTERMVTENLSVNTKERKLLTSPRRPIVVLEIANENWLAPNVAPGLTNIGIMLPYTALHHVIFSKLDRPLVMTSANMPGQPMLIDNHKIQEQLGGVAHGFLLHNREIVSRIDDSVVRYSGETAKFIRRSRGWVPEGLEMDLGSHSMLALGAEQDNVVGLYHKGKVYLSQYLGDTEGPDDLLFLQEAIERILKLTNADFPSTVAHDLHPNFVTTNWAHEINDSPVAIQHHKAHVGSLLAENKLDSIVGIVLDGVGYGDDGEVWGGEVIKGTVDGFDRAGKLSYAYMPGGDLATKHPARMVAGILFPKYGPDNVQTLKATLHGLNLSFPGEKNELDTVLHQLEADINLQKTSSTGRFLDAVSSLLGVCSRRSYEGEPAMKLEAVGKKGTPVEIDLPIQRENNLTILNQTELLSQLIELSNKVSKEDLAATAEWSIAKGMSIIAQQIAKREEINTIGLSGGVAINNRISTVVKNSVEKSGHLFVTNTDVPVGDGGIPLGQLWVSAHMS